MHELNCREPRWQRSKQGNCGDRAAAADCRAKEKAALKLLRFIMLTAVGNASEITSESALCSGGGAVRVGSCCRVIAAEHCRQARALGAAKHQMSLDAFAIDSA
jgi:hypothetical protein